MTGYLDGVPAGRDLAVAVNGRIAATTKSFQLATGKQTLFAAMVPESSFAAGRNVVELFELGGTGAKVTLKRLNRSDPCAPRAGIRADRHRPRASGSRASRGPPIPAGARRYGRTPAMDAAHTALRSLFGFEAFRPGQDEAVRAAIGPARRATSSSSCRPARASRCATSCRRWCATT